MADSSVQDRSESASTAEIVIIGAGMAGLSCAIMAARNGVKVVLIEKQGTVGGTTWVSGGNWSTANYSLSDPVTSGDSVERFCEYALRVSKGGGNNALIGQVVASSGPVLDWLVGLGAEVRRYAPPVTQGIDPVVLSRQWIVKDSGKGIMRVLKPALQAEIDAGRVDLRLHTTATRLVRENGGPVIGLETRDPEGNVSRISARHVVLTGGGYGANREMIAKHSPGFENVITLCPPAADGASILLAQQAGAAVVNLDQMRIYPAGLPSATNPWRCTSLANIVRIGPPRIHDAILVNTKGKRVTNEASVPMEQLRKVYSAEWDKTLVLIFDHATKTSTAECPINNWTWERFDSAANSGEDKQAIVASSVAEIARRAGIDPTGLAATVDSWNACADSGQAHEFDRVPRRRIDAPPYYAIITKACLMITLGGVKVDDESRVVDDAGAVIPGLYAIGEVCGMATYGCMGSLPGWGNVAPLALGKELGERLAGVGRP